jgi:hypothetical protein
VPSQRAKREVGQTTTAVQYRFSHYDPDERMVVTAWGRTVDPQPRRKASVT